LGGTISERRIACNHSNLVCSLTQANVSFDQSSYWIDTLEDARRAMSQIISARRRSPSPALGKNEMDKNKNPGVPASNAWPKVKPAALGAHYARL
jgi:hypothetical protein